MIRMLTLCAAIVIGATVAGCQSGKPAQGSAAASETQPGAAPELSRNDKAGSSPSDCKDLPSADDLKKYNGYIPGYRPGKPTADFLEFTLTRLTFAGALFLTIIAVIPETMIILLGVPRATARFFGGTSILIIVGVLLDTMRQVETHLIQRHYDGFLRKGRIRGRFERTVGSTGKFVNEAALLWMWISLAIVAIAGVTVWVFFNHG